MFLIQQALGHSSIATTQHYIQKCFEVDLLI
ncbi:hypothetical protein FUA23_18330 [Neolewinella aurantiaca]|uniref:Uncharacterized protein n=1 Tax=Neolewinella aurantiaca TaxID=2602767 RepID=A0A5C7FDI2_9BACT|nr:hypothetical protein FUA23_18330 [Neolewinella aurantiaca]